MDVSDKRYLELLSLSYPTASEAAAEIVRLEATLKLPKGPEFFVSDMHGEYTAFSHILKNASGNIRRKIEELFGDELSEDEQHALATLVYYPHEKQELVLPEVADEQAWYAATLPRLAALCNTFAAPYTRAEVREMLPEEFAVIVEDLLAETAAGACIPSQASASTEPVGARGQSYCDTLVGTAVETGCAGELVDTLCLLIQQLAIEFLHVVGDVYDRGPAPDLIMEELMEYPALDIQWGNHDIVWMGASLGQAGCIAHVVRNCARYGNLSILEDAYGINLRPLAMFALDAYKDDPCVGFGLKTDPGLSPSELDLNIKIQKAMAIIQFKVEGRLIDEYPSFDLADRKLMDKIDYDKGTVMLDGTEYPLTDTVFPTVDPHDPYRLTPEEQLVVESLETAFVGCEKLQRHIGLFLEKGSLYTVCNNYLLFHACVPLNDDGSFKEVDIFGKKYQGKALYEVIDGYVKAAFSDPDPDARKRGRDLIWYLWLGAGSPLFAKSKMATFEIYLIADKAARKEVKNPFYTLMNDHDVMAGLFEEFGLDPKTARIVCGHVPVKVKDGEDPVNCDGQVVRIDGGFSTAYQPTTGIAGLTLIDDADGVYLDYHEPLASTEAAIQRDVDIVSDRREIEQRTTRRLVADTDAGAELKTQIAEIGRASCRERV